MTTDRITSPFGWASTAVEVVDGVDLTGKRALVTGASSGIGIETARALVAAGADVTIAARSVPTAEQVASDIRRNTLRGSVRTAQLDLLDRSSIERLAAVITDPLHLLVLNAGIAGVPDRRLSPEGHEWHLATNHLGHFLFALGVLPALRAARGARIAVVSSRAHLESPFVFDDPDFERRPYAVAYAQSKTANMLFAVGATARWADDGILANALHPGAMIDTNFTRFSSPDDVEAARTSGKWRFKSLAQGAATSVFLGTSPLVDGIGGRYFENSQQAVVGEPDACGLDAAGVADFAMDAEAADRLWAWSARA